MIDRPTQMPTPSRSPKFDKQIGFTLLEIMIAITIMATLTIFATQAVRTALDNKTKFQKRIEQDSMVREALKVIERDINLAFHHRDFTTAMLRQIDEDNLKPQGPDTSSPPTNPPSGNPNPNQNPNTPPKAPPPRYSRKSPPPPVTFFVGSEHEIKLTTLSNLRTFRDEMSGDQATVAYYLKGCTTKNRQNKSQSSQCLWRRLAPYIDGTSEIGQETVLLENVEELVFKFYGPEKQEWVSEWKTADGNIKLGVVGDASTEKNFPSAVEITLTMWDSKDKLAHKVKQSLIASLRFPNNPKEEKK